ncbi:unnamed protein product, partial [Mesorhabditis belari]|uniref:Olfactory receptor n=1 Tax=Mesorhabditis belari TaxID=2138241 RepID=A0AAF3FIJ0_9BILA
MTTGIYAFFYLYIFSSIILYFVSGALLIAMIVQIRLREKYSVFAVKFLIDLVTASCLLAMAFLDKSADNTQCGIVQVISASVPLVQCLLLMCEVIDWSLAAFSPIYFHQSSLICRILPFLIGALFSVIIMACLVIIDLDTEGECVESSNTAILTAYDMTLILALACAIALGVLLKKQLNSAFFRPVVFHFVATTLLLITPIIVIVIIRYVHLTKSHVACDIANLLVFVHSVAHSSYFVYNHEDVRQGLKATFCQFRVLTAIRQNSCVS